MDKRYAKSMTYLEKAEKIISEMIEDYNIENSRSRRSYHAVV